MFERILVPLDGSQRAEQAIPIAARLAKASGGSLLLLEVVNSVNRFGLHSAGAMLYLQKIQERSLVAAAVYLSNMAHTLEAEGIETRVAVFSGQPSEIILDVAQEQESDLIVLCSHGHTGFQRWNLGSTSQKVIRQSTIPVLLIREQRHKSPVPFTHSFRVTVALDGSPFAETALLPAIHLVAALSAPDEGELHLLRLVEIPTVEEEFGYMLDDADFNLRHLALQEASHYLEDLHERLRHELPVTLKLRLSWSVEECKDVADALIQIAEGGTGISTHKASQLLAMATHGRSGLRRWLLGSVTERVLHGSALPLLIVHPSPTIHLREMKEIDRAGDDYGGETQQQKEKENVSAHSRSL